MPTWLSDKRMLIALVLLVLAGAGAFAYYVMRDKGAEPPVSLTDADLTISSTGKKIIGTSVEGRAIESHTYGTGTTRLAFIGGIHGGYEWNSVLLAYQFMDYLEANPAVIPSDVSITVIPSANPDGIFDVIAKEGRFSLADVPLNEGVLGNGRFNANGVDLNRNFACKWQATSTWRGTPVSAGTAAFSEPEAAAIRDFVAADKPAVVVFWHSQSNAVYASECEAGILPGTRAAMNAYSAAAGYPAVDVFDAYAITGDAEGWLASIGIPAITVELATHKTVEWEKNLAGALALIKLHSVNQ
jgi:predicted deacylase